MGCDVAKWRKKRQWEPVVSDPRMDAWSLGFRNKGTFASACWMESDTTQTENGWLWLNGGILLEPALIPELAQAEFVKNKTTIGNFYRVSFGWDGYVVQQVVSGVPYSVRFTIVIGILNILGGDTATCVTELYSLAPSTNRAFSFVPMERSGDSFPPFNAPLGSWEITPLDRCHDCSD